jgi:hypothetical protein
MPVKPKAKAAAVSADKTSGTEPGIVMNLQGSSLPGPTSIGPFTVAGWVTDETLTLGLYMTSMDGTTRYPPQMGYLAQSTPVQNETYPTLYDWSMPVSIPPPTVTTPTPFRMYVDSFDSTGVNKFTVEVKVVLYPPGPAP